MAIGFATALTVENCATSGGRDGLIARHGDRLAGVAVDPADLVGNEPQPDVRARLREEVVSRRDLEQVRAGPNGDQVVRTERLVDHDGSADRVVARLRLDCDRLCTDAEEEVAADEVADA